jgi:uncharacterized protein
MMKKLALTCLICCLGTISYSQASKKEKIKKLMDVTGSGKMGVQVVQSLMPSFQRAHPAVPQQFWDDFAKAVKPEDLVDLVVPIYDKYYSEEDIDQIIAFYNSPVGKKMISTLPMVMQESMAAGQTWGKQLADKVAQELKEKGYEK